MEDNDDKKLPAAPEPDTAQQEAAPHEEAHSTEAAAEPATKEDKEGPAQGAPKAAGGGTAIIVPYRDLHPEQQRAQHLARFLQEMPRLMQGHPFHLYIIEQSNDGRKFNRGKLLNIGFALAAADGREVFVFHDVDLLPSKELIPFYVRKPEAGPVHIARVWRRYSGNPKYIGGAVAFSEEDFRYVG